MRKVKFLIAFVVLLLSCEYNDYPASSREGLYTPYLTGIRSDGKVTLKWGKPGCLSCATCACPSEDPDHFEILISKGGASDLRVLTSTDKNIFEIVIEDLTNGQPYHLAVRAVKRGKNATVSRTIMTIPDKSEVAHSLFGTAQTSRLFGTWSPDESSVAYISDYIWNNGNNGAQSLFVHTLGNDEAWLVEVSARSPRWSPAGDEIVYHTDNGEVNTSQGYRPTHIAVLNVRDSTTRRLTEGNSFNYLPVWSPDGEWVAFLSDRSGTKEYNLWMTPSDGGDMVQLTSDFNDRNGLMTKDDRSPKSLTWSPEGAHIAFSRLRESSNSYNTDIYAVPLTGGSPVEIVSSPWNDWSPAYAPDGTSIAFVSDRSGSNQIWTMDLQSKTLRQITGSTETSVYENSGQIEWSSDGDKILYTASANDFFTLYAVEVN